MVDYDVDAPWRARRRTGLRPDICIPRSKPVGQHFKGEAVLLLSGEGGWSWKRRRVRVEAPRAEEHVAGDGVQDGTDSSAASAFMRRRATDQGACLFGC